MAKNVSNVHIFTFCVFPLFKTKRGFFLFVTRVSDLRRSTLANRIGLVFYRKCLYNYMLYDIRHVATYNIQYILPFLQIIPTFCTAMEPENRDEVRAFQRNLIFASEFLGVL